VGVKALSRASLFLAWWHWLRGRRRILCRFIGRFFLRVPFFVKKAAPEHPLARVVLRDRNAVPATRRIYAEKDHQGEPAKDEEALAEAFIGENGLHYTGRGLFLCTRVRAVGSPLFKRLS